ncbi:methyl-accepting chemotaxis protein [Mesobacillus zeae]|uniref:methyl-accepting chemotaxis protein n=1 Tax=Mesobacillus zeae TaxID=1917180 RepID=UPI0021753CF5|nr:methyl-accepting chemotaxis protein [Mesobacillus zeae]
MKALKISTKFLMTAGALLVFFSVIVSILLNTVVTGTIKEGATAKAKGDLKLGYEIIDLKYPGEWSVNEGNLYKGNMLINDNNDLVDEVAKMTRGTVTIFLKDKRVATNVISNGSRAVGTKASDEVVKRTLEGGKTYYGEANVVGHQYQTAYMPVKDAAGSIIGMWYVGAPADMVDKAIRHVNIVLAATLSVMLVLSYFFLRPFTNGLKKRISRLEQALEQAGNGDFTALVEDSGGDELTSLAHSYKKMRESLAELIGKLREAAETMAASSQELSAGAEETARATDSIANSIQEVAVNADNQVEQTNELSKTVRGMTEEIAKMASGAEEVQKATKGNAAAAVAGAEVMEKTRKQVASINDMTERASQSIHQLNEKSKEINKIINLITDISDQTNLLALNAAIEAARAGEHGRGFAVVAEEVRKLAEQSNSSASQVRNLVASIQKDISLSVESMDLGREAIKEGMELSVKAEQSFNNINSQIQAVSGQIDTMSGAVLDMDKGTEVILEVLGQIVGQIHQSSDATQSVASATEEQSASMEEIYAFSQSLSTLAEDLRTSVNRFKV